MCSVCKYSFVSSSQFLSRSLLLNPSWVENSGVGNGEPLTVHELGIYEQAGSHAMGDVSAQRRVLRKMMPKG